MIGPSGAGKSTTAQELQKITGMSRLCLDRIANSIIGNIDRFNSVDEFNFSMISELLKKVKNNHSYGIVDFGAGHSVYDDEKIFEEVKKLLHPFKNIVLLLPSKNETEALKIMEKRSTGDTRDNEKFLKSPCNKELATMTIYENGREPSEIAEEILSKIKERDETPISLN